MGPMPRPRPKYIQHEKTRHGNYVWYFRRPKCERIRLAGEYDSVEFWESYNEALLGRKVTAKQEEAKADKRTIGWLIQQYCQSSAFRKLAPTTRKVRENIFKHVIKGGGHLSFSTLTAKTIQRGMDNRADVPESANGFLKAMRGLMQWAKSAQHISIDPTEGIGRISIKSDGFHVWSVEEVLQFQKVHKVGTRARLAMDLMLYTGLRRSDVVQIGRQHVRDGILSIKTQKTGTWVSMPVLKPLQASIAATRTGDLTFIVTERGAPFTAASFGNWFRKQCVKAKVPGRAHGLRKAAATMAADNGATTNQLMAIFGWTKSAQAEVYTKEADRKRLAIDAAHKMLRGEGAGAEENTATESMAQEGGNCTVER